ncbi:Nn.00g001760.m01.CDS01 [Neocucurbitaria sp. VM-36]
MYRNPMTASMRAPARLFVRQFSVSASRPVKQYPNDSSTDGSVKTDKYPDDKHATQKVKEGDTHNIQEANMKSGMDANKEGNGGAATEGRDTAGGKEKQKKEFPEAPDAIGMQDERGGRGG